MQTDLQKIGKATGYGRPTLAADPALRFGFLIINKKTKLDYQRVSLYMPSSKFIFLKSIIKEWNS
jgi:hypothetical protein